MRVLTIALLIALVALPARAFDPSPGGPFLSRALAFTSKVAAPETVFDLDGGGTVKGNLIGIDPDPEKIQFGMPVDVVYKIAPTKDAEGNEYLTYYFQPRD